MALDCNFASMLLKLDRRKYPQAVLEASLNVEIARGLEPASPQVREVQTVLSRLHMPVGTIASNSIGAVTPDGARLQRLLRKRGWINEHE